MDREIIYLDNDEEITTLVDKLKKTDFVALDLVIPKDALILQSVVNLKLLKRQSESLGKEITIVTQDKVGRKLAEQIGIPVVEKPGEVPKEVRMSEEEKRDQVEEAVESETVEFKKTGKKKSQEDDEDDIEFKEALPVIEPTKEVVEEKSEKTQVEGSAARDPKKKKRNLKKWGLVAGFVALTCVVLAYIYLPMAEVTMKLAAESKDVDFTFTADTKYGEVSSSEQTIPAQNITSEKEISQKFPTTGKKKTGTKASGTVTVINYNYSSDPFTLNAGSRVVTTGGLVFRTKTNVSVPGFKKVGSVVTEGKVDVGVEADQVGEAYNITSGKLAIPGLDASSSDVYAEPKGAFSGGTSRDVQFVTQADINTAKEEIKATVERELLEEAIKKSDRNQRIVEKAYKIEEVSAQANPSVNGEAAEFELKVKAKITAIAFSEEDLTKLAEMVLADQIGATKEIVEKSSLTQAAEFVEGDFEKGIVKIKVTGEAFVATKIDQERLKIDLSGEANGRGLEAINEIDGITEAEITKQFPSFYKRLPRVNNHIYLKIEIIKPD